MSDDTYTPKPVLIRHHYSGVWVGYLTGKGKIHKDSVMLEGRRVWSWSGGRLECSQLASQGPRDGDRLGDWCEVEIPVAPGDGLVEVLFPAAETIERWRTHQSA